jgi:hypothetical protein
MRSLTARILLASALALAPTFALASPSRTLAIDAHQWRVIPRESGPDNYYTVVTDEGGQQPFVRGRYRPPMATAVLGFQIPSDVQSKAQTVRWRWRVVTLPPGANECAKGKEDSAAVVYLTWKRALKWYTIKYVWSTVGPKGETCDKHTTPFSAQETVILQSGGPTDTWQTEEIDLRTEFRRHFAGGDPSASVPDFIGIGLMTDADQTKSEAAADYGGFEIGW